MTDLVDVLHPSPLIHMPPRARKLRLDLVETRTPVRLTHAPEDSAETVLRGIGGGGDEIARLAGEPGLWSPVGEMSHVGWLRAVRPAAFVAFLSGNEDEVGAEDRTCLVRAFARTPLVAVIDPPPCARGGPALSRGAPLADAEIARVRHDARGQAADDLRAYLDARVRIVGGRVYRRVEPTLRALRVHGNQWGGSWSIEATGPDAHAWDFRFTPPALPVSGAEEALRCWHAYEHLADDVEWGRCARDLALLDMPEGAGLADVVDLANRLPGYAERRLDRLDRSFPHAAASLDAEFRGRLEALAVRGMTGAITEAEAPGVLGLVAPALLAYAEAADHPDANDLHGLGSYVAHAMVPRLGLAAEVAPEDGLALGSLAP